jgi:hypothetical protein
MDELLDEKFDTFTHGSKATYAYGCKGPLCRKAERDACAVRYRKKVGRPVKEYTPREGAYPEDWLQRILDWHREERKKIGKTRSWKAYYQSNRMNMPELATAK